MGFSSKLFWDIAKSARSKDFHKISDKLSQPTVCLLASQPASPLASHPTPISSPINRIFIGLCSLFTSNHGASEFTFCVNCMCLSVYSKRPNQVVRLSSNPYRTMKLNPNGYVIHNFRSRLYILSTNILIFTHFQSTITCKLRTAKQLF